MRRARLRWLGVAMVLAGLVTTGPPPMAQPACTPTPADALGPFYTPNAPARDATGRGLVVTGTVRSAAGCGPLPGARLEWWSANGRGRYDDEHRATQTAGADGGYRYETDTPGRYPGRPPHLHVRVAAPGHRILVTQVYPKPEQSSLTVDFVLVRH